MSPRLPHRRLIAIHYACCFQASSPPTTAPRTPSCSFEKRKRSRLEEIRPKPFQVKPGSLPYSRSLGHSYLVSRDGQSRFIAPPGLVCLRVRACQGASPANAAHLSATLTHTP